MLHAIVLASVVLGSTFVVSAAPAPPTPQDAAVAEAVRLIQARQYEQALQLLHSLSAEYPDWPLPQFYIGSVYYDEKRWESALSSYRRVLELAPGFHKARLLSGWCLLYLGELAEAREAVEGYLQAVPDSADARFALGLIELDEDNVEPARALLEQAIEMTAREGRPAREASIRTRLADLFVRTGEMERAKLELGRSIELDPTNEKTYFKLSRVLQRLGDDEGAAMAREKDPAVLERLGPEDVAP